MNPSDIWRFKWRAISYFGSAACAAGGTGLTVAAKNGKIDTVDIVICLAGALAAGFAAIKGLFDQKVDTSDSPAPPSP